MCSSILSKYAFYQYFNNMSRSLKVKLPRGNTSSVVDHVAVSIAKSMVKMLLKVTKTNMTNYKRIKDNLRSSKEDLYFIKYLIQMLEFLCI